MTDDEDEDDTETRLCDALDAANATIARILELCDIAESAPPHLPGDLEAHRVSFTRVLRYAIAAGQTGAPVDVR